jgi:hypothetical protein
MMVPSSGLVEGPLFVVSEGVAVESVWFAVESPGISVELSGSGEVVVVESVGVTTGCSSGAADLLESSPQALKKRSAAAESAKLVLVLKFM